MLPFDTLQELFYPKLDIYWLALSPLSSSISGCALDFMKHSFLLESLHKIFSGALLWFTSCILFVAGRCYSERTFTFTEGRCAGNFKIHLLARLHFSLKFLPFHSQLFFSSAILSHCLLAFFQYSLLALTCILPPSKLFCFLYFLCF